MNGLSRKWRMLLLAILALVTVAGVAQSAELTGTLTSVAGGVQVTGPGVEAIPLAQVWQVVRSGVTVRLAQGATAGIVCSNRRFVLLRGPAVWVLGEQACLAGKELTPAEYSLIAPQAGRFKVIDGLLVLEREIRTGEGSHPLDPVVLSPRNTRLRDLRPTVVWQQVPTATEYQVLWTGGEKTVYESIVKRDDAACGRKNICSLPWPNDRPALQSGEIFSLRVSARDSFIEPWHAAASLEVHTLSLAESRELDEAFQRLKNLPLRGNALEVAQAGILAQRKLYSDAIDGYTRALTLAPTPELKVTLGDLNLIVGLLSPADNLYREVLETGTSAAQAAAMLGTGRIQYVRGHYDAAAATFRRARILYASVNEAEEEEDACRVAEMAAERLGALRREP